MAASARGEDDQGTHLTGWLFNDVAMAYPPLTASVATHHQPSTGDPKFWGSIIFTQNVTTGQHAAPYIVVEAADAKAVDKCAHAAFPDPTLPSAVNDGSTRGWQPHPTDSRWNLHQPSLLISVTGGAQAFDLKPRLEDMFTKGLTMAAKNTAAWIITGGADAGVMSYVGKAFRHVQTSGNCVPIIGIAPFLKVLDYKNLRMQGPQEPILYSRKGRPNTPEFAAIEPNHTHFIFVEAPPEPPQVEWGVGGWGTEIALRAAFEAAIIKKFNTPNVLILVEGGNGSVETVLQGLEQSKDLKVVIIEKSGRAADLIPLWKRRSVAPQASQDVKGVTELAPLTAYEQKLLDDFEPLRNKLNKITGKYWGRVHVFNLHEKDNFEDFLYDVILKGETSFLTKIVLTTEWKSATMLKEVMKDHLSGTDTDQGTLAQEVSAALQKSLLLHSPDIFSILMDYCKIKLVKMADLYLASYRNYEPVRRFVERHPADGKRREVTSPDATASDDEIISTTLRSLHREFPEMFYRTSDHGGGANPGTQAVDLTSTNNLSLPPGGQTDAIDVILWALLNRYMDLALRVWRHAKVPIHCALYASKICKVLAGKEEPSIQKEYLKAAESFEDLAVKVLDEYSSDDLAIKALEHPWARLTLSQESRSHGRRRARDDVQATAMQLAVSATAKKFISSQYYQASLQRIWMAYESPGTRVHYQLPDSVTHWHLLLWTPLYFIYPVRWMVRVGECLPTDPSFHKGGEGTGGCEVEGQSTLTWKVWLPSWQLMFPFYQIPMVKFWTDTFLWLLFLAYLVAISFTARTTEISPFEWVFYYWLLTLDVDAAMQAWQRHRKRLPGFWEKVKVLQYLFPSFWNKLELVNYITLALWMALRIISYASSSDTLRHIAHEVLLPAIAMSFVRILNVLSIFPNFGPLLVTIGKMLEDIVRFLCLLLVFVVAFGVIFALVTREWWHLATTDHRALSGMFEMAENVTMLPDELTGDEWKTAYPYGTATLAYWSIMGEFAGSFRFLQGSKLGSAMLGMYVLIAQILMVNLLIAMMSDTYTDVRDNADREWKMARFSVIMDFIDSSQIPPPLTMLYLLKLLLLLLAWPWQFKVGKSADASSSVAALGSKRSAPPSGSDHLLEGNPVNANSVKNPHHGGTSQTQPELSKVRTFKPGHQGGDYSGDYDLHERMCKNKLAMLEQQAKDEERSVVSKVSSVEQDLKALHALHQKEHEEMDQRINQLERSMINEFKKAIPAVPPEGQGVTKESIERLEQRLISRFEDMLTTMLNANKAPAA